MLELWGLFLAFTALVFGLGPALMPAALGSPLQRTVVGVGASVVILYLLGFAIYALHLPVATHWLLLALPPAVLGWRRARVRELYADAQVRAAALAWLALTAWLAGWQFMVLSYSGATWMADWFEHYERAAVFIQHGDIQRRFLGGYTFAARPPLANLVTGVFLAFTGVKFHVFQAASLLLASLVVWPVCLLAQRLARPGTTVRPGWLILLLMTLPALAQNAAFTWTKLPTVFFVLLGLALLSFPAATFAERLAGWLALTAGMLVHYSAGPWVVAIAVAVFVREPAATLRWLVSRQGLLTALACGTLFASWIGWALLRLGAAETFGANSTIADSAGLSAGQRLGQVAQNLYYSAVPVFFRPVDYGAYRAADGLAHLRDAYFNAVQSSIPMIAGCLGVAVAAWLLWLERRHLDWRGLRYWGPLLAISLGLGIAVVSGVYDLGVAQICLVAFALLVTAWLAARLPAAPVARWVILPGLLADFLLGIVLHFGVQSLWLLRPRHPGLDDTALIQLLGHAARENLRTKLTAGGPFLHELPGSLIAICLLLTTALVLLALSFTPSPATRD